MHEGSYKDTHMNRVTCIPAVSLARSFASSHACTQHASRRERERESQCTSVCVKGQKGARARARKKWLLCVSSEKRQGFLSQSLECVQLTVSLCVSANRSLVIISTIQTPNTHTQSAARRKNQSHTLRSHFRHQNTKRCIANVLKYKFAVN